MKKITYRDLQLDIEKKFSDAIESDMKKTFYDYEDDTGVNYLEEKHFHNLLIDTIEIKGHYLVDAITERIKKRLDLKDSSDFKLYLYQDDTFNINCFLRKDDPEHNKRTRKTLFVFVSPHFFNSLNEDEQVGIIGHEIAHQLFGHFKYPIKSILSEKMDANTTWELKSNLIYRSKIGEITADLIGLVSNDFNHRSYSTALIKYTTGLDDSANSTFSISPLIDIVLKQYNDFADDPYIHDMISTHPIMPLRVKIINEVVDTKLIKHFGDKVSLKNYNIYKKEFNETVNNIIKTIYPELFLENENINEIIILMSIAVVLADKEIHESEDKYIRALLKKAKKDYTKYTKIIFANENSFSFDEKIEQLIVESIRIVKDKVFDKSLIVPIIRKLLLVASSDGEIVKEELNVIYKFGKNFGIYILEIVQIINTQYKA